MIKLRPYLTLFVLILVSCYTFAATETPTSSDAEIKITIAPNDKIILNTPHKPPHCLNGCSQAEDCRNNERKAKKGYTWKCLHDVIYPGACNGACEQIRIP